MNSKADGVNPRLISVFEQARATFMAARPSTDVLITEGLRSMRRQRQLVAAGASQTMKSKHLEGRAIDVAIKVAGKITWKFPIYREFADHMKRVAKAQGVPIVWGGDWRTLKDGPHFQV